jgi:hypothetical protein
MNLSKQQRLLPNDAALAIRKLISCYPSSNPLELKGYVAELADVLAGYSDGVAVAGLEKAMLASPAFPPPVPLVRTHCDELIASSRAAFEYASQWEAQSREQLRERERIEAIGEPLEYRRAVVERVMAEYHAAIPQSEKPKRETWQRLSPEVLRQKYPPTSG